MKKLLSAFALAALVAAPAMAQRYQAVKDARAICGDAAQVKKDQAQSADLMKKAAQLDNEAAGELKRAGDIWQQWSKLNHSAANRRAQARSNRFAASKLNAAAAHLLQ